MRGGDGKVNHRLKVELAYENIVLRREMKAKSRAFRQWTSNDFKQEIERLYRELGNAKADAWEYKRQLLGGQYHEILMPLNGYFRTLFQETNYPAAFTSIFTPSSVFLRS